MKQLTVRGFDKDLARLLRQTARRKGVSLSQAALGLMRAGAGMSPAAPPPNVIGGALDGFFGTWSEQEARDVLSAVAEFERVDNEMWR